MMRKKYIAGNSSHSFSCVLSEGCIFKKIISLKSSVKSDKKELSLFLKLSLKGKDGFKNKFRNLKK